MTRYTFGPPIQEGMINGEKYYVVEITEHVGSSVTRRTKIGLKDAKYLLGKALEHPYETEEVKQ